MAQTKGCHRVVTPNPEVVMTARRDAAFQSILHRADLVLPDGVGILYGARILGRAMPGRVPGIDFAQRLLPEIAAHGLRLYLLGAKPGVAAEAGRRLGVQYPGLIVCGTADGYFSDAAAAAAAIHAAAADVVFVCLGAPKQELWMAQWGQASGASLLIGLGGSLDIFAGTAKRAPAALRRIGLEWLYRLIKEPRRIGRMARLPLFLAHSVGARIRGE